MSTVYKNHYRQRVYGRKLFPHHKIQVFGTELPPKHWPDGEVLNDAHKEEDSWIEVSRTVSPYRGQDK